MILLFVALLICIAAALISAFAGLIAVPIICLLLAMIVGIAIIAASDICPNELHDDFYDD